MGALLRFLLAILTLLFPSCLTGIAASHTWTLDDFEDGDLKGASGLSWIVIADDLAGGATGARLELRPGGPETPRHALRLIAKLGAGTPSFAGAWIPLERSGRNLDLSGFDGIRLRVRGSGRLDVGFRSGVVNFMAPIDAGPDWQIADVPFAMLKPTGKVPVGTKWNASALQVFGITTPQSSTGSEQARADMFFEVDDVTFYRSREGRAEPIAAGPETGLMVVPFAKTGSLPSTGWTEIAADPERDGRMPALPDATRLEVLPSTPDRRLWVRVTLREVPHDRWIGMNLALDTDGDPTNGFAWWGANTAFKFDRIVTVWCFRVADGCQGYIGIGDAAQAASGTFVAGAGELLRFAIDRERHAFVLGIPRDRLGLTGKEIRVVAAVGSALLFSDDVPGQGAAIVR
jgi:hypothetical protein